MCSIQGGAAALRIMERHARAYRHSMVLFVSGAAEPIIYFMSIGLGLGKVIRDVPSSHGNLITYRDFVAPALIAVSAMNGVLYDSTLNIFVRLKHIRIYDAMLATSIRPAEIAVGETGWALVRGALYSAIFIVFLAAMGILRSVWAILDLPVAVLSGLALASIGMAGTTYMKSWQHTDYVILASTVLFLFSGTFYPTTIYPAWAQAVIEWTPLYESVVLLRDLTLGEISSDLIWRASYLALLGIAGIWVSGRRIRDLLLV